MRRSGAVLCAMFVCMFLLGTGAVHGQPGQPSGYIVGWGDRVIVEPSALDSITAIAAGYLHSLVLHSDGTITAWGNNEVNMCVIPAPNADFIAIAGHSHNLGLRSDGTIVAWGRNDHGECDVPAPNDDFVAVAAGFFHSLGLKSDSTIVAWGRNDYGQCDVPAPNGDFVAIAAGDYHSLGLKSDGTIVAWGRNEDQYGNYAGQCDVPAPNDDFVAIAAGGYYSLGLTRWGTIEAWGANDQSQCAVPWPNDDFVAIAAGYNHGLGLKSDSTIVGWGYNYDGECDVPAPNADFVAIAAGHYFSLGLKSDGTIVAWGSNEWGQCYIPASNTDFVAIAGGDQHDLGLKADGTIVAWGSNDYNLLNVPEPNANFVAIAAGNSHNLGLKSDSTIVAWGANWLGQCDIPLPNADFVAIATIENHSLGLKADGTIEAWGDNGQGQCNVPEPNTDFVAIATGCDHSLGLKVDGTIVAWGNNSYGQCNVPPPDYDYVALAAGCSYSLVLKNDGTIVSSDPGWEPSPNADFVAMSSSAYHILALKADGTIVAEGSNYFGQCDVPAPNAGFVAIGTGEQHSLGIRGEPYSYGEVVVVPSYILGNCSMDTTAVFAYRPLGVVPEVRGYEVTFAVDTAVAVVDTIMKLEEFLGDDNGANYFDYTDNGGGSYTVSRALLGGDTGEGGGGDMFEVVLTPVDTGTCAIDITSVKMRDLDNNEIPTPGVDGMIEIQCIPPTMEEIYESPGQYYSTAPSFSNFGFDDDFNLDRAEYRIDAGGWLVIFSDWTLPSWDNDGWVLPGFDGLAEGPHTVDFHVRDDAGNWNGGGTPDTYSWWFIKDTAPPQPPRDFIALPGHEKVHLSWINPTGDTTLAGIEIRRNGWRDCPEYLPPEPSYPADETEGTFVIQASGESNDDEALSPRDIYYYSAFAYDSAGNYSNFDTDAADRSTNYWLGDIDSIGPSEGEVDISDVVLFSNAFGTTEGSPGWVAECDFGPTDDWSRFGIPLPDDVVDFEDLMILAMNYGKVDPLGARRLLAVESPAELEKLVSFSLNTVPEGEYIKIFIVMENEAASLKGVRLIVNFGSGAEIINIKKGSILAGQSNTFFGTAPCEEGKANINIAALGIDHPLEGSGEVATLLVKAPSGVPLYVSFERIDLRNTNNERTEIEAPAEVEVPYIPTVSALFQNHPNPFNPVTTIAYDIARAGRVSIKIYDVSGSLVRTLVDAHREPGRYRVEWNSRNDNGSPVRSGIYFYRMTAPGFGPQAKKMLLLR